MSFNVGDLVKWTAENGFDDGGIWEVIKLEPFTTKVIKHKHHQLNNIREDYEPWMFRLHKSAKELTNKELVILKIKEMESTRKERGYVF